MKAFILIIFFLVSICHADAKKFTFVSKSDEGLLIRSEFKGHIFIYGVSGSDFLTIQTVNGKMVKISLEEKGDSFSLKKHEQAARSKTHGYFLASPGNFVIEYPDGYKSENFEGDIILRIRYRYVVGDDLEGKLQLSEIIETEIRLNK